MKEGSYESIADRNLLIYKREIPGTQMFVVLNLGTAAQSVKISDYFGTLKKLMIASVTSANSGIRQGRLFSTNDVINIPKDAGIVFE